MNKVHKAHKVVGRACVHRAPGKKPWHAAGRSSAAHDPKCGHSALRHDGPVAHRKAAFCPALQTAIGEPVRKLLWHNLNLCKADTIAEPLKADIIAELRQGENSRLSPEGHGE